MDLITPCSTKLYWPWHVVKDKSMLFYFEAFFDLEIVEMTEYQAIFTFFFKHIEGTKIFEGKCTTSFVVTVIQKLL